MRQFLRPVFSVAFLFLLVNARAQNLVVNPSFEITNSNCANFGGEDFFADLATTWDNASNNAGGDSCSSPDLFSACNTLFGIPTPTGMPASALGYQYPHTGTRYAGIITYDGIDEYREYIQGRLTTPLVAGQTYCVSMYVSHADDVIWATNNIGVYFSNTHYLRDPCPNSLINVTPQLNYACSAITDTSENWFRLQWNYTATGGERYLVIGNFFNNANTIVVTGALTINPYAYYFIDDVSVVANSCCYAQISAHAPFCTTDTATNLSVTSGVGSSCTATLNGTWSGTGITNASLGTFNPVTAGVGAHVISYTLPCGYVDTETVVVGTCAALNVCSLNSGGLQASNGLSPYTWYHQVQQQNCSACLLSCIIPPNCAVNVNAWQSFATGDSISSPGSYPIRVVDNAGQEFIITSAGSVTPCSAVCSLSANITGTNATCGGNNGAASVNVSGANGSLTYAWSTGGTSSSITNISAGVYFVTVTSGSCSATANVSIGSNSSLSLLTSSTNATCGANNGSASVTASGGNSSYSYSWSNGGSAATISNIAAGNYSVTVTDTGGCSAAESVSVSATGSVSATTTSTNAGCTTTGSATAIASGGNGSFTYAWSNGGTSATISNLAGGNYTVTVTSGNCSATASATVASSGGGIALSSSVTNTTCGANNGAVSITPTSGTLPFNYSWSNGATTSSISNIAAGNYSATVTDGNGCSATLSAVVNSSSATPAVISTNNNLICSGDSTQICVQGNYVSYHWNTNETTQCIFAKLAGNYYLTATDNGNCTVSSNHLAISVYPLPPVSVSVNGDTLTAYNAVSYQWYLGTTPIQNATSNVYIATQAGDYYVAVTDSNGCRAVSSKISVTATDITNVASEENIKIYPNPLQTGNWNLDVSENLIGASVEIFDASGRLIYKSEITNLKSEISLNVASGIYMIHIRSNAVSYTHKLIKL